MMGAISTAWRVAKVLPWRYILAGAAVAGLAWTAYSWSYDRGYSAASDVLRPQIDALSAQIAADEKARQEAAAEAARLAKQWEQRRDAIQAETDKLLAAARSDNYRLRKRVLDAAQVPTGDTGGRASDSSATTGQCSLPEARAIVLRAAGNDLVRWAEDADKASAAAVACNAAYDQL
jgi:hypothetical protein